MNVDDLNITAHGAAPEFEGTVPVRAGGSGLKIALALLFFIAALLGAAVILGRGTGYAYGPVPPAMIVEPASFDIPQEPVAQKRMISRLKSQQKQLVAALAKKEPKGIYVVVDQTQNRLYLKKDEQTVLEAVCSAGSGMVLKEGEGGKGRVWVFDTPRGLFHVKSKQENPVWSKPDWAFIEEGKPIPKNKEDRLDYGTLGEYSFQLGNAYMIHGTLYERLLGRSVTHGCIRVGRDDLRVLWKEVPVGTPVYIY